MLLDFIWTIEHHSVLHFVMV